MSHPSATASHASDTQRTKRKPSRRSSDKTRSSETNGTSSSTPELHVNGSPVHGAASRSTRSLNTSGSDDTAWGSNFWVTLVDPQTQVSFFACPATGDVSWDPPVGNFVLPANDDGEWWEIIDESNGVPYYYHTKSGETVWQKPNGFVIPLSVLQNTALGRRLSRSISPADMEAVAGAMQTTDGQQPAPSSSARRSHQSSPTNRRSNDSSHSSPPQITASTSSQSHKKAAKPAIRRSNSSDQQNTQPSPSRSWSTGGGLSLNVSHLPTIPASPYSTDTSAPPTPVSNSHTPKPNSSEEHHKRKPGAQRDTAPREKPSAPPSSFHPSRSPPQSLNAAVELFSQNQSAPSKSPALVTAERGVTPNTELNGKAAAPTTPRIPPRSVTPQRPVRMHGKEISGPILNEEAARNLSPVKNRSEGRPIIVEKAADVAASVATLRSGAHRTLPEDLASDIQQFVESDFARRYFTTHRTGLIFKRKVPVEQMMSWQKAPLAGPLLNLPRVLHKDAIRIFRVIQKLMGDRDRETRAVGRLPDASAVGSGRDPVALALLEEERWLLYMGLLHGELRDEIYCQVTKQLSNNPNPESTFKGWQLLCVLVISFPPSKNFETYLQGFLKQRTTQTAGRIDIMAKHCLKRLYIIAKRGPRGKPPTVAEIETASDAAFNPSTFGEPLDAVFRLQERNYPHQKIPIVLPFLADGILALGGTKSEGIFRVPGDGDLVSELKLRIDKGYYTLEGVDDPHVLASLLKLWLRELQDPLIPEEMYNDCIAYAADPEACIGVVERLPTINRRVVLFVVSFLQLFLDERVLAVTKMTSANLALVMAPNLLRCNSESMAVVFTNAQFEQTFVHNLLLNLKCDAVDSGYVPRHGLGALSSPQPRTFKAPHNKHPSHT